MISNKRSGSKFPGTWTVQRSSIATDPNHRGNNTKSRRSLVQQPNLTMSLSRRQAGGEHWWRRLALRVGLVLALCTPKFNNE